MPDALQQLNASILVMASLALLAASLYAGYVFYSMLPKRKPAHQCIGIVASAVLVPHLEGAPACEHDAEGRMITRVERTEVRFQDGTRVILTGDVRAICAVGSQVRISLKRFHQTIARLENPPEPQPPAKQAG